MTAGEKERKTLERFSPRPPSRQEIVLGKIFAAITAIFLTADAHAGQPGVFPEEQSDGDPLRRGEARDRTLFRWIRTRVAMIALILIPMTIFAASVMFAIALVRAQL